jgi:tRNA(adenine34) deaminase
MAPDQSQGPSEALRGQLPALMRRAIAAAKTAELPFGAVLAEIETGLLLVDASNASRSDPTAHAEMNALRHLPRLGLKPSQVVVVSTAEPCPMCAAACWWARVAGVVFGTEIQDLIRFGWRQLDLPMAMLIATANEPCRPWIRGGFQTDETNLLYRDGPR